MSTTAVTIRVVTVMPEMGVTEIMAMAQADTVVKTKAMPSASSTDTSASRVAPGIPAITPKR